MNVLKAEKRKVVYESCGIRACGGRARYDSAQDEEIYEGKNRLYVRVFQKEYGLSVTGLCGIFHHSPFLVARARILRIMMVAAFFAADILSFTANLRFSKRDRAFRKEN